MSNLLNMDVMLWVAILVLVLYPIATVTYNLLFHPLARYPGAITWRACRLPYMKSVFSGYLPFDIDRLHTKYGRVVRIAPNELSFADAQAFEDIYSNRGESASFSKTKEWHSPLPGRPTNVVSVLDHKEHARMRKKMEGGFTERAVARQEMIVQEHVGMAMKKIAERVTAGGTREGILNIVPWFTFTVVDIIGDLAFGEPFGCLREGEMDVWANYVFNAIKGATFVVPFRHYTFLAMLINNVLPRAVKKTADEHWNVVEEKVDRRLKQTTQRPDLIADWTSEDKKAGAMTLQELYGNSWVMNIAGSETTATTLCGTINRLVKEPEKLRILAQEIRDSFERSEDITFAALKDLPYLNAVVWEGLRMCNPLLFGLQRYTPPEGATVCGQYIPGKMIVSAQPLSIFFDTEYFHAPNTFFPERWLPEAKLPDSPFHRDNLNAVQVFSVGPRSCIGKPLALAELRLILAKMVWTFDISEADTPAGRLRWEDQRYFIVAEKKPFEVTLRLRQV